MASEISLLRAMPLFSAQTPSRRLSLALGLVGIALLALWLPVHATLPLGRDQAIIGRVAQILVQGGWPYVDAWDHKGPATYLLYAPVFWLFGAGEHAIYQADIALLVLVFAACRSIGVSIGRHWLGGLGLLGAILFVRNDYWTFGQPDLWIGYFTLGVTSLLVRPYAGASRAIFPIVGAVIGVATLVKPVFVVLLALPLATAWIDRAVRRPLPPMAACLVSFVATTIAIILPFVVAGHGGALYEAVVAFNLGGHLAQTWDEPGAVVLRFLLLFMMPGSELGTLPLLLVAGLGARDLLRTHRRSAMILGTAWLLSLLGAILQGKAFPYHFAPTHVLTAVFAAAFVARHLTALVEPLLGRTGRSLRRHAMAAGILAAGLLIVSQPHRERIHDWWATAFGQMAPEIRDLKLCQIDYCPVETRRLATIIQVETPPGTPIFVWGFDSAVYLLADRPAATRFGFDYPLIGGSAAWRSKARAELMRDLRANRPTLIVIEDFDFIRLMLRRSSRYHLAEFPELTRLLTADYVLAHDLERFTVYRLRD